MTTTNAVRPAREVGALPWARIDGAPGVRVRTLWESPTSRAVLLLLDRDARVALHVHPAEEHHAFVVEGRCAVDGRVLGAGSYAHVAAGVPHDVRGEQPSGARILYVFERGAS